MPSAASSMWSVSASPSTANFVAWYTPRRLAGPSTDDDAVNTRCGCGDRRNNGRNARVTRAAPITFTSSIHAHASSLNCSTAPNCWTPTFENTRSAPPSS